MFPPQMITHFIGQQQQQLGYSSDNHNSRYCYNINPFEHCSSLELLRGLVGLDMPPIRNNSNRGYGRGGHSSIMMPPNTLSCHHSNVNVTNYWNKSISRPPRCTMRELGSGCSITSADTDSGFSSRSPTPVAQGDAGDDSAEGTTTLAAGDSSKGVKRLHEVYGGKVHSHQESCYHQAQQQQPPPYFRSNGYQNKRRYHNNRQYAHPPPPLLPPSSQQRPPRRRFLVPVQLGGGGPPVFTAPDHFLARAHLMQVSSSPPASLTTGSQWDKLSTEIWNKFIGNQQTEETYKKKMLLWKYLYIFIKTSFPRYGLFLVGSTMSGFGSDKSDVDMCLVVRRSEIDQRSEAVRHLEQMLNYLRCCDFVDHPELIQAKVPILKFRDTRYDLEVDLNCNNSVGIRNTHMLYCYSQMDWRVRPLVLIVKLWAHAHNINDAKNMTISSYSLVLMVINFLQCGVSPPVLPCLHGMYHGKFSPHSDIQSINIHEDLRPFYSDNTQTLGELLYDFLQYYVNFDFSQFAISVRLAGKIPIEECRRARSYKNDPHQWKYLCIEEPFDLTNTARSVYDRDVFEKVKQVFMISFNNLRKTRDIGSIFRVDEND